MKTIRVNKGGGAQSLWREEPGEARERERDGGERGRAGLY